MPTVNCFLKENYDTFNKPHILLSIVRVDALILLNCLILRFGSLIAYKPYCLLSINSGVVVYYGSLLPNAYKKQHKWATLCLWCCPSPKHTHAHTRTLTHNPRAQPHTQAHRATLKFISCKKLKYGRIMQRWSLSSTLLGNQKALCWFTRVSTIHFPLYITYNEKVGDPMKYQIKSNY